MLDATCELADAARSRSSLIRSGSKHAPFCHITASRSQPNDGHARLVSDLLEDEELLAHLHMDAVAQRHEVALRRGVLQQAAAAERAAARAVVKLSKRRAQVRPVTCCVVHLPGQAEATSPAYTLARR